MQSRIEPWRGYPLVAAALILSGVFAADVAAQQLGNKADTEEPFILVRPKFNELLSYAKAYNAKEHEGIAEKAARYYTYQVTWPAVQQAKDPAQNGLPKVQERFREAMEHEATKNGKNKVFMQQFAKALIPCFQEVLAQDLRNNPQAVTTIALMLPTFGKCKQDEVGDFLSDIVKDTKQNRFIRMCAIKGLGEMFPAYGPQKREQLLALDKLPAAKLKSDLERLDTIKKYIHNLLKMPADAPPEYVDANIYLRREGIKALAQVQMPALAVEEKGKKVTVIGPAAFELALLLTRDKQGHNLCTFPERLEAAIGLCQLVVNEMPKYRAEVGLYCVGLMLVDMENEYSTDHSYFSIKPKDAFTAPRQPKLPWKATSMRVKLALDEMVANLKDTKVAGKADKLRGQVKTMLDTMGKLQPPGPGGTLTQFVATLRPDSGEIYEGSKEFIIALP